MAPERKKMITMIPWNLLLITMGAWIFSFGVKAIVVPQGFITGGIAGVGLLSYYFSEILSPGIWYFIINIPLFIIGWALVSRRFFLYSIYGMVVSSIFMELVRFQVPVNDPFLAALAGGAIVGAGTGITLHSLGSLGGNDIVAIVMNQKYSMRMGTYFFIFNLILFAFSFVVLNVDTILYSLAMSFVTSVVLDHVLTMFNQRKVAFIISDHSTSIAEMVHQRLRRGATYLHGSGTYTEKRKRIILTVVNNYQLKRLEELVFNIDPQAFLITENTFNVLGKGFSRRKVY
jgi:uncharacterized membrane-anchored protein YitT (DUF2179 family)